MVLLFYAWLVVGVAVLIRRLVGRRTRAGSRLAPAAPKAVRWAPPPTAPDGAPPALADATTAVGALPTRAAPIGPSGGGGGATSLMKALSGISLPCDLLPLTTVEGRTLTDGEVLLMTAGHEPEDVAAAMRGELQRLGYEVIAMGADNATARRGPDHLRMVVHRRPDTVLAGKKPAFPSAQPGSVVVELTR